MRLRVKATPGVMLLWFVLALGALGLAWCEASQRAERTPRTASGSVDAPDNEDELEFIELPPLE